MGLVAISGKGDFRTRYRDGLGSFSVPYHMHLQRESKSPLDK